MWDAEAFDPQVFTNTVNCHLRPVAVYNSRKEEAQAEVQKFEGWSHCRAIGNHSLVSDTRFETAALNKPTVQ